MLIKSYVVHTTKDDAADVCQKLSAIPGCEYNPATNANLVAISLESQDQAEEDRKLKTIESLPQVLSMALVFGADSQEEMA